MKLKLLLFLTITPLSLPAQWTNLPFPEPNSIFQETKTYVRDSCLFIYTGGVLHRTSDNGNTWTTLTDSLPKRLEITSLVHSGDYLIACMFDPFMEYPGGIFHSNDNGDHWQKLVDSLKDISDVYFFLRQGEVLFAYGQGSDSVGIYRSDDNGISWNMISTIPPWEISSYVATSKQQLLTTFDGGLFLSSDSGRTWEIHVHPRPYYAAAANERHFFGSSTRLYRSDSNGDNWMPLDSSYVIGRTSVLISKDDLLFGGAIGDHGSVFYSSDDGEQWIDISENLGKNRTYFLAINDQYLFAGLASGVWRYSLGELSAANEEKARGTLSILSGKKNSLSIHFQLPSPQQRVTFQIYDLLGRSVASQVIYDVNEGSNNLSFPVDLRPGMFICKMLGKSVVQIKSFIVLQ